MLAMSMSGCSARGSMFPTRAGPVEVALAIGGSLGSAPAGKLKKDPVDDAGAACFGGGAKPPTVANQDTVDSGAGYFAGGPVSPPVAIQDADDSGAG